jgi:hypothetical protein
VKLTIPRHGLVWIDVAVKAGTVAFLLLALAAPDWPQFQGKAFEGRAVVYPIALAIVPLGWWLIARRRMSFPAAADVLIGLPFLIDMAGNALNLYDSIDWWDDANHLVNWALHTGGIAILLRGTMLPAAARFGIGLAWASTTAIAWELLEYVTFVPNSPEAATAYRDTLGDLLLGVLGGAAAAAMVAWWPRRPRARATEARRFPPPSGPEDATETTGGRSPDGQSRITP